MAILDANVSTIANPAVWRTKLGLDPTLSALIALTARVAALETALDSAEARIATLEGQILVPSVDVRTVDGVDLLDYAEVPAKDWQPVVLESPEECKLYRVQPIRDDAGAVNFDLVPADILTASDGRKWRLAVQLVDGVANLNDPELIP
jgi:hypothetical protein